MFNYRSESSVIPTCLIRKSSVILLHLIKESCWFPRFNYIVLSNSQVFFRVSSVMPTCLIGGSSLIPKCFPHGYFSVWPEWGWWMEIPFRHEWNWGWGEAAGGIYSRLISRTTGRHSSHTHHAPDNSHFPALISISRKDDHVCRIPSKSFSAPCGLLSTQM